MPISGDRRSAYNAVKSKSPVSIAEISAKGTGHLFCDGPESSAPQVFPYISALFEAELLLDDAHQFLGIGHGNCE